MNVHDRHGRSRQLTGRHTERHILDSFVVGVRDGAGRALVVRAAGVQSEMELAFAGLHQLCAPLQ